MCGVSVWSQADMVVLWLVGGRVPDRGTKHGWSCPRPWDEDVWSQTVGRSCSVPDRGMKDGCVDLDCL